jgi:hypothetical protein
MFVGLTPLTSSGRASGLHQTCRRLGFVPMILRFTLYAVSLLAVALFISACASQDEGVVRESTTPSEAPVDRPVFTPGSQGMSASHW